MGREDAKIMIGPNYNNIDTSDFISTGGHTIKVIGTVPEMTYCDSIGGKVSINKEVQKRTMLELKDFLNKLANFIFYVI